MSESADVGQTENLGQTEARDARDSHLKEKGRKVNLANSRPHLHRQVVKQKHFNMSAIIGKLTNPATYVAAWAATTRRAQAYYHPDVKNNG
jgi:hypothetical protein